jgi:lipid-A-disaccharide synthase
LKKYLIVAGDPSADKYSANLMREIKLISPDTQFIGIGGPEMIVQGLLPLAKMSEVAVVGFWEVAKKYNFFKKLLNKCADILKIEHIDAFIPIDYPGFNIRLAKFARKLNIPVYYYIAPQLWAWGKNRAKNFSNLTDKLFVVFPFEVEYFAKNNISATFVGHPLLDNPIFAEDFKSFSQRNNKVAFFPGSRIQEVNKHLKLFSEILKISESKSYNFNFVIAKSSNIPIDLFSKFANNSKVEISDNNFEIMQNSSVGIIKTGTSNLEAALCGLPFGMFYKTSFLTYKIAENLVNLPYISIVNILLDKPVVREFIQQDAKPDLILSYIKNLFDNPSEYNEIQQNYNLIRKLLGGSGAAKRVASEIISN